MFLSLKKVKKKYIKLCLLATSLIGLMVSSGFSFAKYRDENYGGGNAGAAKFGAKISNTTKFVHLPTMGGTNAPYGYYAFIAEFNVDFTECEVNVKYNLGLKLCGRYSTNYDNPENKVEDTTFSLGQNISNIYTAVGDVNEEAEIVEDNVVSLLTEGTYNTAFNKNTSYYATSTDGKDYSWTSKTISNSQEINFNNISANTGDIHYYKLIYFIFISGSNPEISIILSNLELEQVV